MYRQSGHFNGHWFAKHNSGLTLEDATRLAPALAASSVKPGLTTRYGQVHTSAVVEGLLGQGYLCVVAVQHDDGVRQPSLVLSGRHRVFGSPRDREVHECICHACLLKHFSGLIHQFP